MDGVRLVELFSSLGSCVVKVVMLFCEVLCEVRVLVWVVMVVRFCVVCWLKLVGSLLCSWCVSLVVWVGLVWW